MGPRNAASSAWSGLERSDFFSDTGVGGVPSTGGGGSSPSSLALPLPPVQVKCVSSSQRHTPALATLWLSQLTMVSSWTGVVCLAPKMFPDWAQDRKGGACTF